MVRHGPFYFFFFSNPQKTAIRRVRNRFIIWRAPLYCMSDNKAGPRPHLLSGRPDTILSSAGNANASAHFIQFRTILWVCSRRAVETRCMLGKTRRLRLGNKDGDIYKASNVARAWPQTLLPAAARHHPGLLMSLPLPVQVFCSPPNDRRRQG